jgi:transcriptional regulator with PAS, ATPase and Fis domain
MSLGRSKPPSGDVTTQIDVVSQGPTRREDRAYVMVRVGEAVDVRAVDEGGTLLFGRGEEADVVVDDARVSRRHAEITMREGRLAVKDLGSRNGTRVGPLLLRKEERVVVRGDEIVLGPARATIVAAPAPSLRPVSDEVIVVDPRMRELVALAEKLAAVPTAVLVRGETGAGKEILAELLHVRGPRRAGPLVRLNCAAIPETLLESEFFGHERGAFSGATDRKVGFLERAHGGTLFLDELGDLPLAMQAKLLRALETQRIQRLGGREEIGVDVRFVCASHHDLERMIAEGRFRADLYYRVAGFVLEVPSLRERSDEIIPLAEHFATRFATKIGQGAPSIAPDARDALLTYRWPGNVRELKNAIEHAVVLAGSGAVVREHLPRSVLSPAADSGESMREHVDSAERRAIERALASADGHRGKAAEILGISKRTLQYRLAKLGLKG